ncbi:polysaccharide biosynthesis/export family protein [Formosa sp. S-31]|uniref:polysaccharide biosynthesis/export family protein n=1 Tax=Formosa sp. S-31 TaxID=2790949 RepID=UPI003EBFD722
MRIQSALKLLFSFVLITSCATKKEILYFQDYENIPEDVIRNMTRIQVNDILNITVKTIDAEAAEPYNRSNRTSGGGNNTGMMKLQGYLVRPDGRITFPILGDIHVSNKTTKELQELIHDLLVDGGHLKQPTVIVRIINAKFTVLGEVKSPGTKEFDEETLTLPQAIGIAGDLQMSGVRNDIMIIREVNGVRTVGHIDMTKTDWFTSPYYNIKQNDVIVVNPNGPKVKSAGYISNIGGLMGAISFIITLILLIQR